MEPYFPIFIPLAGVRVVVIGAGKIALRRVEALLPFGAEITVIAPGACEGIQWLDAAGKIRWERRGYQAGDLVDARLAVSAADKRSVNYAVFLEAEKLRIPVSIADCKEESTFYFPGIAREGALVAGVTASGTDHALAKKATVAVRACLKKLIESRESDE